MLCVLKWLFANTQKQPGASAVSLAPLTVAVNSTSFEARCCCPSATQQEKCVASSDRLHSGSMAEEILEGLQPPSILVVCGLHLSHERLDSRPAIAQSPANVLVMDSCCWTQFACIQTGHHEAIPSSSWCVSRGVAELSDAHGAYLFEERKRSFKSQINDHKQTPMSKGRVTTKQRIKRSLLKT